MLQTGIEDRESSRIDGPAQLCRLSSGQKISRCTTTVEQNNHSRCLHHVVLLCRHQEIFLHSVRVSCRLMDCGGLHNKETISRSAMSLERGCCYRKVQKMRFVLRIAPIDASRYFLMNPYSVYGEGSGYLTMENDEVKLRDEVRRGSGGG